MFFVLRPTLLVKNVCSFPETMLLPPPSCHFGSPSSWMSETFLVLYRWICKPHPVQMMDLFRKTNTSNLPVPTTTRPEFLHLWIPRSGRSPQTGGSMGRFKNGYVVYGKHRGRHGTVLGAVHQLLLTECYQLTTGQLPSLREIPWIHLLGCPRTGCEDQWWSDQWVMSPQGIAHL